MGNRNSLGKMIVRYSLMELLYTFLILFLSFLSINLLINYHIIYPANYPEQEIAIVEEAFQSQNWDTNDIPYYYDYKFIEGDKIEQTINHKYDSYIEEATQKGRAITNSIFSTRVFVYLTSQDKELVLSYRISPFFTSKSLYNRANNFEALYFSAVFIFWVTGFLILVRRSISIIRKELKKVSETNDFIKQMNLDFPRKTSRYLEIGDILSSLDSLSEELRQSLEQQWSMEEERKNLVQSVTHDIRTPITLIKGNLELLEEESNCDKDDRLVDIYNGVQRLESYVDKLSQFTSKSEVLKARGPITEQVVDSWVKNLKAICLSHQRELKIGKLDTSSIRIDKEGIERAVENIVMNSIENSLTNTTITISFSDSDEAYRIEICDEGTGFDELGINLLTDKYRTSKRNEEKNHGLGLYIVKNIMEENQGELSLKNVYHNEKISGAMAVLTFKKKF